MNKKYCHTCMKPMEYPAWEEADYFFFQKTKRATSTYTIDYVFCSAECMSKYKKAKS